MEESVSLGKPRAGLAGFLHGEVSENDAADSVFSPISLASAEVPAASVLPATHVSLHTGGPRLPTCEQMVGRRTAPKSSLCFLKLILFTVFFFLLSPSYQLEASVSLNPAPALPEPVMKIQGNVAFQ